MDALLFEISGWQMVKDGDPRVFDIFRRHYSYREYKDGRRRNRSYRNRFLIAGPGEKIVLLHNDGAIWVWRKFIDKSAQNGVNCAVFRNESNHLSSDLILSAEKIARCKWPSERLYTYVNGGKVKSNNPGYCFQVAGWKKCGITSIRKLLIFEKINEKANT